LGAIEITDLPQIGEVRARLLRKLGIRNLFDLLYYLPRRYEDRRLHQGPLSNLETGQVATVRGVILDIEEHSLRRGLSLLRVRIGCGPETATATWFNQPFLKKSMRKGLPLSVTGKVDRNLFGYEISVVDYEVGCSRYPLHVGRIVPIYGATEDLSQRYLRRIMFQCIKNFSGWAKDILPSEVKAAFDLLPLPKALFQVHFPDDFEQLKKARERLVIEELFLFLSGLSRIRKKVQSRGVEHIPQSNLPQKFLDSLPFPLTQAQRRVIAEIESDLTSKRRMYRLLQGDVGCGKTVVALYALFFVVAAGYQGVLMAPTEVLAEQHFLCMRRTAESFGVRVGLLTGSLTKKERDAHLALLRSGEIDIVVGTHALLEREVAFKNLGLIVIDEQHRFGVNQRDLLTNKAESADVLIMTATPIPRSLTLTVYGDLELSVIDELPSQRRGVQTYFLPVKERGRAYHFLKEELGRGRQAFVVCPLIEESEKLEVEAAIKRASELREEFPEYRVGLLHGRLKIEEKDRVMDAFRRGEIQILVATSVIEVGIDVPNASLIIIEGAERFGLAQLHQLRGRVGRGKYQGYCVLTGNPQTREARERMKTLVKCSDGFQVAEKDLFLRGPGELVGTRQHGISDFRIVNIFQDSIYLNKITKYAYHNQFDLEEEVIQEIDYRFPTLAYVCKF